MPKQIARIVIEAPVASFRYPHFLIGRQPTFDMPPPSTIFGQVAAALGHWPKEPIRFAYTFDYRSRCSDLEHQHVISRTSGNLPGNIRDPLWMPPVQVGKKKLTKKQLEPGVLQKTTEAVVQPHFRDFLFDVRLELFIEPVSLIEAFRSPVFAMSLGRSQDLAAVGETSIVNLETANDGYIEKTLLPAELRSRLPWGVTCLMPRYIGPSPERIAVFASYILLRERVYVGKSAPGMSRHLLSVSGLPDLEWFVDPNSPLDRGGQRLLLFQTLDPAEFEDAG